VDGLELVSGIASRLLTSICANPVITSDDSAEVPKAEQFLEPGKYQPKKSKETLAELAAEVSLPLKWFWSKPAF